MGSFVEPRFWPYEGRCWKCLRTPILAEKRTLGPEFTGLCGACFFGDEERLDPVTWNRREEDDEIHRVP